MSVLVKCDLCGATISGRHMMIHSHWSDVEARYATKRHACEWCVENGAFDRVFPHWQGVPSRPTSKE